MASLEWPSRPPNDPAACSASGSTPRGTVHGPGQSGAATGPNSRSPVTRSTSRAAPKRPEQCPGACEERQAQPLEEGAPSPTAAPKLPSSAASHPHACPGAFFWPARWASGTSRVPAARARGIRRLHPGAPALGIATRRSDAQAPGQSTPQSCPAVRTAGPCRRAGDAAARGRTPPGRRFDQPPRTVPLGRLNRHRSMPTNGPANLPGSRACRARRWRPPRRLEARRAAAGLRRNMAHAGSSMFELDSTTRRSSIVGRSCRCVRPHHRRGRSRTS